MDSKFILKPIGICVCFEYCGQKNILLNYAIRRQKSSGRSKDKHQITITKNQMKHVPNKTDMDKKIILSDEGAKKPKIMRTCH